LSALLSENPLLQACTLPPFDAIQAEHIEPALDSQLATNRQRVEQLLLNEAIGADQFLASMEQWDDELAQLWSPVGHLQGVSNSEAMRLAYDACLPKLTAYATEMGQNTGLYRAYKRIKEREDFASLSEARRRSVENALRDFTLSGIALDAASQQRFGAIQQRVAQLSTQFSNNVLDASMGWSKHISDASDLVGVPAAAVQGYAEAAAEKGLVGYSISLDIPAYLPVLQYGDSRELRQEMYLAYNTRASDQGPGAGQWDNSAVMQELLALRHELAALLGYNNYAEYSLATKMADTPAQVESFLMDLAEQSRAVASADFEELAQFAEQQGQGSLAAWDIPYYSEKLRLQKYALSQEELRPYFPVDKVIAGMFEVVNRLYGIDISPDEAQCWHPDVRFYQLRSNGQPIAQFYLDLYAREHKRGGAWMDDCRVRRSLSDGAVQLPVAYLTCNFTAPTKDLPSLLTHNEVTTLFHEFGHGLHHMLSEVDCPGVSGINGVPWDAVELPSQFLENWCWQKEVIPLISGHYQSGEALPMELLDKMLAAKNFQAGMQMVRQLELGLFDFRLHRDFDPAAPVPIAEVLARVRDQVAVFKVPKENRFQHGFSHIFAGGYAAGYYSYKWAEVLSADAFSRFEEEGIFNASTGASFQTQILQRGGVQEPMALFINFRGREPSVEALLRHSGIRSEEC